MTTLTLGNKTVGLEHPAYFVADISANHDGSLERAKLLIRLCAEAGANAAKFQNFRASKIVSQRGFESMATQLSPPVQMEEERLRGLRGRNSPMGMDSRAESGMPGVWDRLFLGPLRFRGCGHARSLC